MAFHNVKVSLLGSFFDFSLSIELMELEDDEMKDLWLVSEIAFSWYGGGEEGEDLSTFVGVDFGFEGVEYWTL